MACVLRSDDRLIWNAALSLLALLSAHMPKQQLSQMLEVICLRHYFPPAGKTSSSPCMTQGNAVVSLRLHCAPRMLL